ncbi:hypothetical protein LOK49_LG13G00029 [Camellia lanceoleosa]|uniref:Uncharacterized protein n=1 Tax=Camellia lanceoleosa TaxID=1840588 RepID=A0ACC0FHT4_9ERIC|nr:hypothetical protein LOK49_LG13G00029 [Camellia lanceoleosa]
MGLATDKAGRWVNIRPQPFFNPLRWGGEGAGATQRETPRQTCPQPNGFGRNLRSKTRWFAGFCNSHQVSHFATFFIDARAEISVAESRVVLFARCRYSAPSSLGFLGAIRAGVLLFRRGTAPPAPGGAPGAALPASGGDRREGADGRPASIAGFLKDERGKDITGTSSRVVRFRGIGNDPSAGSPTETLLRLLLPLNDKVQWTSHDVAGSEPPTSPRSEHFTGPFNR